MTAMIEKKKGLAKTRIPIAVAPAERLAKPEWIRVRAASPGSRFHDIKRILREKRLHTVCEEASCPNIGECFGKGTATFMILGDLCTRRCPFCDVAHGRPLAPDPEEPAHLAHTIAALGLAYVVITSVDRDDLKDGGARHFVDCTRAVREVSPATRIEVLVPDFRGRLARARWECASSPNPSFFRWSPSFVLDEPGDAAGEGVAHFLRAGCESVREGLRDHEAGITAGIDRGEGREIHVHVERDAVVAAAAPHPKSERRNLRAVDIYARRAVPAFGSHAVSPKDFDHCLLDQAHHAAHCQSAPFEINQNVHDRLPRTVIGDLPAAVDPLQGNRRLAGKVFFPARDADGVDGRVLEHPELVGCCRPARIGKPAHRLVGRRILGEAEMPDDRRFANLDSRFCGNDGGS